MLWEAQFGDFANGAQIIIDQFIAAGEDEVGPALRPRDAAAARLRRPGAGALERAHGALPAAGGERQYADLPALDGGAVLPSAAAAGDAAVAQAADRVYAEEHAAASRCLVVSWPTSPKDDFRMCCRTTRSENPRRLLVCSGKIGHNLRMERAKRKDMGVGIIFVEQLYPWPKEELQAALDQHPGAEEIVWVQEEPANMGALSM